MARWPQSDRLHGRSRPCDTPSPNLTPHNLTLMWQVGHTINLNLFSNLRPCSGDMRADVNSNKNVFLVQNMRHEVLHSKRHRSRTLLSKATHLTPPPYKAAKRCAQRARRFVWQCRSHSEADDHLVQHLSLHCLTLSAMLNLTLLSPPLYVCNFGHYFCFVFVFVFFIVFVFSKKKAVLRALAHHNKKRSLSHRAGSNTP